MNSATTATTRDIGLRDARPDELDAVSRLLEDVYGEFRPSFPRGLRKAYLGEIVDVRSRSGSPLIVGEAGGPDSRAPEFDIEIAEMLTGRPLPADQSWHAEAFMLDLEGSRR